MQKKKVNECVECLFVEQLVMYCKWVHVGVKTHIRMAKWIYVSRVVNFVVTAASQITSKLVTCWVFPFFYLFFLTNLQCAHFSYSVIITYSALSHSKVLQNIAYLACWLIFGYEVISYGAQHLALYTTVRLLQHTLAKQKT